MILRLAIASTLCLALVACEEEAVDNTPDPVRAIKHTVLGDRAGAQERRIAGIVTAAVSSNVAFETNGQIVALLRKAGDRVRAGELIAQLDPIPFELQVSQAQNSFAQAEASLEDARKKFAQQEKLFQEGFATQTAFDSAKATFLNAQGAVGVAQSELNLAKRDLTKTDLKAPFDGVVGLRQVEVFEEVTGGEPIYSIQTSGEDEVEASLPETMINQVTLGSIVEVSFPPLAGAVVPGEVTEIAPLAGDANAYPIKVSLTRIPPELRPGMSAEVIFRFDTEETGEAFIVPLSALLPDDADGSSTIFVYDPATSRVSAREVTVTNLEDNQLVISGDLQAGEIIATAGVSFLHDGMETTLFDSETLR